VKRDKKRGNLVCGTDSYRRAIHAAVCAGGDRDAFTDEPLRWDLIRTYDNAESKSGRRGYKKQFALLPTVDHLDDGLGLPKFAICGWRTNDCKGDLSVEELADFSHIFLKHQKEPNRFPEPTPASVTPAASAPGAPPSGAEGL
jgi:hypothetical protein